MAKAKAKPELNGVTFIEGDAEDIPLPTDKFDRYTSAGSIEYWPEPQRGVCEAYRILKPGGWACLIGPVEPTNPISKFFQGKEREREREREKERERERVFSFFIFFSLQKVTFTQLKNSQNSQNSKSQSSLDALPLGAKLPRLVPRRRLR